MVVSQFHLKLEPAIFVFVFRKNDSCRVRNSTLLLPQFQSNDEQKGHLHNDFIAFTCRAEYHKKNRL